MANAKRDQNFVPTLIGVSSSDGITPTRVYVDPVTHRLLVDIPGGVGTVSNVSVATANGFAGTVATSTSTPVISIETTISGLLKGNGTSVAAAVAGDVDLILPTQTGNNGKFLTTNGTTSSWAAVAGSGTVTSVAMTTPTGLTVTGSPITTSGTLALSLTAGYEIPLSATLVKTNQSNAFTVGGQSITVADTTNVVGLTINQNDTTNTPSGSEIKMSYGGVSAIKLNTIADAGLTGFGPGLEYYYSTNATPNPVIGWLDFYAPDSASGSIANTRYVSIESIVTDNTNTTEDGYLSLRTIVAGTLANRLLIGNQINGIHVGSGSATGIISSNGNQDVSITTGNATTGNITIANGANGQITLNPNGTGVAQILTADPGAVGTVLELYQNSASPAALDDVGLIKFFGNDSGAAKQEYARITGRIGSPTATSESGSLRFGVTSSGTLSDVMTLTNLILSPITNDGLALGNTTTMWSDLFLASGGVINWNNGNATLTHSNGLLTSNVPLSLGTTNALTAGTIELGNASDTTLSRSAAGVLAVEGVVVDTVSAANTLTNKRITKRVSTTTSTATLTPTVDNYDVYTLTAQAAGLTIANQTGTLNVGDVFAIYVTDNGSAQTIAFGTNYKGFGQALPTTTTAGKTMVITCQCYATNTLSVLWANQQ